MAKINCRWTCQGGLLGHFLINKSKELQATQDAIIPQYLEEQISAKIQVDIQGKKKDYSNFRPCRSH